MPRLFLSSAALFYGTAAVAFSPSAPCPAPVLVVWKELEAYCELCWLLSETDCWVMEFSWLLCSVPAGVWKSDFA